MCVAAAVAAAAFHVAFLWPVARHVATDIPRTSRIATADSGRRVPLAPGDHLQLLYHFQLVAQMTRGEIPLFANPWEFNLGEDARTPDPYYAPFSLLYAALERPLGPAGAWNATQLASVLIGALLLLALATRYATEPLIALAATLAALCVPYRWETLAGGSPTGFGMAWVPGVALGLDIAVRDRRASGGLLAGAMLLLCYTTDLHCFLFAGLAAPLWCVVAALHAESAEYAEPLHPKSHAEFAEYAEPLHPKSHAESAEYAEPLHPKSHAEFAECAEPLHPKSHAEFAEYAEPLHPKSHAEFAEYAEPLRPKSHAEFAECAESPPSESLCVSVLKALVPFAACGAVAFAIARHLRRAYAATDAAGGRTIAELRGPNWDALLDPASHSFMGAQFFLGWGLVLAIVVASALVIATLMRRRANARDRRAATAALLLALAVLGAILLAMSQRGPMQGIVLRAVRKLVPPFRMVRQPIKVFCLLPTLLAPLFAWMLAELVCRFEGRRRPSAAIGGHRTIANATAIAITLPIVCLIPVLRSMRAATCTPPRKPNAAYTAAVADANSRGETARALVLPIWPGDSAWSSVYQFHAASTGMRMVNGYAAVKTPGYVEDVFGRFQTVTQGELTGDDLAVLARHKVNTIILHEDAFPEKVSPAPVGATLRRLLAHPRLALLAQDGPVWAWRLADAPHPPQPLTSSLSPLPPSCGCVAPARAWHFDPPFQPTSGRPLKAPLHKTATWMRETFLWQIVHEDGSVETLPPGEEDSRGTSWLRVDSGAPVRDVLFAPTPFVEPGFLSAADLFHAGFTVLGDDGKPRGVDISGVPAGSVAIYGPRLLLREPGAYGVSLRGTVRPGDRLDVFLGGQPVPDPGHWFVEPPCDGPLEIRFIAGGEGPCVVEGFELERKAPLP